MKNEEISSTLFDLKTFIKSNKFHLDTGMKYGILGRIRDLRPSGYSGILQGFGVEY